MKEKPTLTKVYARPTKATMPTLLKFQNGKLAAIQKENTQYCRLLHSTQKKAKAAAQQTAMVVANGQIYHGQIEGAAANTLTSSYIAVRNKTTNNVRLIPMEQVRLSNDIYNQLAERTVLPNFSEATQHLQLMKEFGSRKAQRFIKKREEMQMNIDMVKDELDKTVQAAALPTEEQQEGGEQHMNSIRPKFNKDAKKLVDVYDINDVVPEELLARLDEEAKVVFATTVDKLPVKSEYLRNCIEERQGAKSASAENLLHMKIIIYMDSLLNAIKTKARSLAKVELSGITEKVENDVRRRFSGEKCIRTASSIEKALCHFIVLALLMGGEKYEVKLSVLSQELGAPRTKIVQYAQICNARPKAGSDTLALRLPSTVPPLSAKFFKKSKK